MSFLVGITGGIGSGKTTVSNIFFHLGYKVYNSDDRAKYLMERDSDMVEKITDLLGDSAYKKGFLNKKLISESIYNNNNLREKINAIVHPITINDFNQWVNENPDDILIKESALIYQTSSYKELDCIICVKADQDIRIKRILSRDKHRNEEDIMQIMRSQVINNKGDFKSHYIIENNGKDLLLPKVIDIVEEIKSKI
jgi:dephospho-CoA kinase